MRKLAMTLLVTAAAACSGAATIAHGETTTSDAVTNRSYDASGFDGVGVVGPHHVTVTVGPAFSISADGPADMLAHTEVVVEHGMLQIRPTEDEDYWRDHGHWRDYKAANFRVTLPRLTAASMVGSGDMAVDRVREDKFDASVAGSGTLDIASLAVGEAQLSVAGSGDLVAHGTARSSQVSIAGSGKLHARDFASESADVSIAGSGDAELTVNDDARVSIVGSGRADIAGSARCTVSRIGSGRASCAHVEDETEISFR